MAADTVGQKNILQRFNRYIGGAIAWIGILLGCVFFAGGVTSLALTAQASATAVATAAVGLSVLSAGGGIGLGVVGIIIGLAIVLSICLSPIIKKTVVDRKTKNRQQELAQDDADKLERDLEQHRLASARDMRRFEERLADERAIEVSSSEEEGEKKSQELEEEPAPGDKRQSIYAAVF